MLLLTVTATTTTTTMTTIQTITPTGIKKHLSKLPKPLPPTDKAQDLHTPLGTLFGFNGFGWNLAFGV